MQTCDGKLSPPPPFFNWKIRNILSIRVNNSTIIIWGTWTSINIKICMKVENYLCFPSDLPSWQAYELSTLTGTQVLLLVASETGHVYTFATRKLQPMITSETGKALIQTCLNSPDSPPRSDPSTDQRMSATGFEETDLTYQVSESESLGETKVRVCTFLTFL